MFIGNVMVAPLHTQMMRLHQDIDRPNPFRRLELVTGELDFEAVWIVKINRVHEAAVALDEFDATFAQTTRSLQERRTRDVESNVLRASDFARRMTFGILTRFAGKNREQTAVAGVEIEVVFIGLAQIGLLEDERHAQRALPEIDRALLRRPYECDVVNTLDLYVLH